VNPVVSLKIYAVGQIAMAYLLFAQEAPLATTIGGITAFGTFANLVVLIGLIYKIGRYTGTTDQTIAGMRESISSLTKSEERIIATQDLHGIALSKLEVNSGNMQTDLRAVRDRQHDFASLLTRLTMERVELKPVRDSRASFTPGVDG